MKRKFNKAKFNIKRLSPHKEDIEKNKCTHDIFAAEDGECQECGTFINTDLKSDELLMASAKLIQYLETMKMVINNSELSKSEIRAAKKYTDIIPLLKNINALYDICKEQIENSSVIPVDNVENNSKEDNGNEEI